MMRLGGKSPGGRGSDQNKTGKQKKKELKEKTTNKINKVCGGGGGVHGGCLVVA